MVIDDYSGMLRHLQFPKSGKTGFNARTRPNDYGVVDNINKKGMQGFVVGEFSFQTFRSSSQPIKIGTYAVLLWIFMLVVNNARIEFLIFKLVFIN
jgi:hypothetical protein